jgi:DNA-binding MarR family transcriptional regulator
MTATTRRKPKSSPCHEDTAQPLAHGGRDPLAQELLQVTMCMMRSVAAGMRRSSPQLEPGQMGALFRLSLGPATVSDLARYLGVSVPTASKSIGVLEGRGWIERGVDQHCRRQIIVRLTAKGRRITTGKCRESERQVGAMLTSLTSSQRAQLMATIKLLSEVLPSAP